MRWLTIRLVGVVGNGVTSAKEVVDETLGQPFVKRSLGRVNTRARSSTVVLRIAVLERIDGSNVGQEVPLSWSRISTSLNRIGSITLTSLSEFNTTDHDALFNC
jgi:hypothetical protein